MVVTCSRDCVFSLHDCRLCEGISQNWFIPSVNNIDTGTGVIPFPIRVGCADEAYTGAGRTGEEDSGSIYARAFSR